MFSRAGWVLTAAILAIAQNPASAGLVHRYSFTSDASDSVGTRHGTLAGGATVSGGAVQLSGSSQYVDFNGNDIGSLSAVTLEAWGTYSTENTSGNSRVFEFSGAGYFLVGTLGYGGIGQYGIGINMVSFPSLASGNPSFLAVTISGTTLTAYVNGVLKGTATITHCPSLSSIGSTYGYLGKSVPGDPYLKGSMDEFRIYGEARTGAQIAADYAAGPNAIIPEPGAITLLVTGLVGLLVCARRRRK